MQQNKQNNISVLLIITVVIVFIFLFGRIGFDIQTDPLYILSEGWEISQNNEILPETAIGDINKSIQAADFFVLKTTLPEEELPAATLRLYSIHSCFKVLIDGEQIYSYGDYYLYTYGFVPQGYTLVPLPKGYAGRELTIIYMAAEDYAFSGFKEPLVGTLDSIVRYWVDESSVILFAGIYLLMFGFITTVIAVFTLFFYNQKTKALAGGILAINIGLIALSYSNALFFVTCNLMVTSVIEYVSQISLMVTAFALAKTLPVRKGIHAFFNLCFFAAIMSLVTALVLQYKLIVPLPTYLIHYQRSAACATFILFLILASTLVKMLIDHHEKKKIGTQTDTSEKANFLLYASFLILIIFLLIEVIFYQLMKYFLGNESTYSHFPFVIGISGFSVLIFLSYLFNDIAIIQERNQSERLERMAYSDALTGLYNKAFLDNALKKLTDTRTHFSVLMMDVNHLKNINDTLGHHVGDELLKAFAKILIDKFRKNDILCRVGGDEFLVLMANGTSQTCKARIQELTDYLAEINAEGRYPFEISVSMGYALSSELKESKPEALFALADERMYEIKREIHGESSC